MKQNVTFYDFCDSFSESYKNNFTYEGKRALYDYLIDYEESCDIEIELDPIALCCEYNEYSNIKEYTDNYNIDIKREDYDSEEDYNNAVFEHIEYNTTLIKIENSEGFIIGAY
jgi:hypothetical protein